MQPYHIPKGYTTAANPTEVLYEIGQMHILPSNAQR